MSAKGPLDVFLLSRAWRDGSEGVEIILWGRSDDGPVRARFTGREAVMFVRRSTPARASRRRQVDLTTMDGEAVDALYFRSQVALVEEQRRLRAVAGPVFESDLKPHERFLMERFVASSARLQGRARRRDGVLYFDDPAMSAVDFRPSLETLAIDVETDGFDGPLLSAAMASRQVERVFVVGEGADDATVTYVRDERSLLTAFFGAVREVDPDILTGWNVIQFDLAVIAARCRILGVPFLLGRGGEAAKVLLGSSSAQPAMARVPGRAVLDGVATLKSATIRFDRFTLEHVAGELLGKRKSIAKGVSAVDEIRRMHAEDRRALAAYNLEDCRLVNGIFDAAGLVAFAMERARLTGLPLDRPGGSVAAFDHLYLPRLHRRGVVAPDVAPASDATASPGGHVLDSAPGLYRDVLAFDFRSLYPSIIRTFRVDPLGLHRAGQDAVVGPEGIAFARDPEAILPSIIDALHEARTAALAVDDEPLSRAIKILMNSFYGVLGTPACRFFDARLPTAITRTGHKVIERARQIFVEQGLDVIYGDTDSLFVHTGRNLSEAEARELGRSLAEDVTRRLAREVNEEAGVASFLELRFDAHYLRFLMPTTRGAERGSKKRYAGTVRGKGGEVELVVRGLEAVRTDWTPLARRVQRELLRRVFADEPVREWLEATARKLEQGDFDDELVYRKRLRRPLDEYPAGGAPPHVRAARLRADDEGRDVAYVVTSRGPVPEPSGSSPRAPLDYVHYLDKQLAPACDVVLPFLGTSFDAITAPQAKLF